jgi:O-antigen ligase
MWPRPAPRIAAIFGAIGSALLAAFAIVVLASLLHSDRVPWLAFAALAVLAAFAAIRPAPALLAVAALTPVAGYLGRWIAWEVAWAEALVVAFAAGWWIRSVRSRPGAHAAARELRLPVRVFAIVLLAAVVVALSVDHVRLGSTAVARALWQYFARDYFIYGRAFPALHAAALLFEGLLLFAVGARISASDRRFAGWATRTLAASAAAAAALNLVRLSVSTARFDNFWTALAERVTTVRINEHFGDLNAAGSQFVMFFFIAAGLTFERRRLHPLWLPATLVLALGVWMSGSRAALFACPVAVALVGIAGAQVWATRRTRLAIWLAGAVLALTAVAVVVYAPARGNQKASSVAVRVRVELARTTARMVADSPVFGIGLGQFYQRSGEFSSPELLHLFPPARHENAHNNFLQVLGETGLIGLFAFVWLLAASIVAIWRGIEREPASVVAWSGLAGIAAFLLTCLGGHPLLTREVAYTFWLLLGVTAGAGVAAAAPGNHARDAPAGISRLLLVAAAMLLVSIPVRAAAQRGRADLEHQGIGLSTWATSEDNVRYRSAVDKATLFVPSATGFHFRIRTLAQAPVRLEVRLDGRVADLLWLAPGHWNGVAFPARTEQRRSRFSQLDLRVIDADVPVTLFITKVEALGR